MLRKLIIAGLLALTSLVSFASPAKQEREQFCTAVALVAAQAAEAKNVGFPAEEFKAAVKALEKDLAASGLSKAEQAEVIIAVKRGFARGGSPATAASEVFADCVNRKQT